MLRKLKPTRSGGILVFFILVAVTAIAGLPYYVSGDSAVRPDLEEVPIMLTLPPGVKLEDLQRARVQDVVDGDTISILIGDRERDEVRYFGVDTPERGDACYREATDRNSLLLGSTVLLLPDQRQRDDFGRRLAYVFLPSGQSLDATLVAEGFGHAWERDGRYRDEIVALQRQAEAANRGCLWKDK